MSDKYDEIMTKFKLGELTTSDGEPITSKSKAMTIALIEQEIANKNAIDDENE